MFFGQAPRQSFTPRAIRRFGAGLQENPQMPGSGHDFLAPLREIAAKILRTLSLRKFFGTVLDPEIGL